MKLQYLIIHCTATPEGREVTTQDIEKWHLQDRGWSRVGYSDMILLNGDLVNLIPFDLDDEVDPWEISYGAKGMNAMSRHVVYVGGCDDRRQPKDTRTEAQKASLRDYIRYAVLRHPHIQVAGHYHFAAKACPSFDVAQWCESIDLEHKNIYRR